MPSRRAIPDIPAVAPTYELRTHPHEEISTARNEMSRFLLGALL
jgi:hypothetical protein